MAQFEVEDDVVEVVWVLADPKPFENLSFSAALRRVLQGSLRAAPESKRDPLKDLLSRAMTRQEALPRKTPSPSAAEWAASVPELKSKKGLTNWQAICDVLDIDTAGDSARRKLKNWVRENRPSWPAVPSIRAALRQAA